MESGQKCPATRVRALNGGQKRIVYGLLLLWSLAALLLSLPYPYWIGLTPINEYHTKACTLSVAVFLAFVIYPANQSNREKPPAWWDWALAFAAAMLMLYPAFVFWSQARNFSGEVSPTAIAASFAGLAVLLEALRRAVALPVALLAGLCLAYFFVAYTPSAGSLSMTYWLSAEGAFGVPLGLFTAFTFLAILLGSGIDRMEIGYGLLKRTMGLIRITGASPEQRSLPRWAQGRVWTWILAISVIAPGGMNRDVTLTTTIVDLVLLALTALWFVGTHALGRGLRRRLVGEEQSLGWSAVQIALTISCFVIPILLLDRFFPVVVLGLGVLPIVAYRTVRGPLKHADSVAKLEAIKAEIGASVFATLFIATAVTCISALLVAVALVSKTLGLVSLSATTAPIGLTILALAALTVFHAFQSAKRASANPAGIVIVFMFAVMVAMSSVVRTSPGLSVSLAIFYGLILYVSNPLIGIAFQRTGRFIDTLRLTVSEAGDWLASGARNAVPAALGAAMAGLLLGTILRTDLQSILATLFYS